MVDALQRAHGWLRPTGCVLDAHPTAEPAYLEVQLAAGIVAVGRVNDIDGQAGPSSRHARADAALAEAVTRGWIARESALPEICYSWRKATGGSIRRTVVKDSSRLIPAARFSSTCWWR